MRGFWLGTLAISGSLAGAQPAASPAPLPAPGELAERATPRPGQSYVLVLPPGYDPRKAWPILYVLDTDGRGRLAAERFAAGAARFGFVLASSNNSRANGPSQPNVDALNAMLEDTRAALALDPRRAYLAGFSGTARFATAAARRLPGQVAGVIGCGAGFSPADKPARDLPFAYYALVGDRDFNFAEMQDLHAALRDLGVPHALSVFAGGHSWPPAEAATRALAWMELRAMAGGLRPRDPALVQALLAEWREEARKDDVAGQELAALERVQAVAADFAGLADVAAESERARLLEASPAVKKARGLRERAARAEASELRRIRDLLARALREDERGPRLPARLFGELGIKDLQERAQKGDPAAARILAEIGAQAGFFVPREARERGDFETAVLFLGLATLVAPEKPQLWLALAAAEARRGSRPKAKEALGRAVSAGLVGRESVTSDPDLAPLLKLPEFQALVAGIPERPGRN